MSNYTLEYDYNESYFSKNQMIELGFEKAHNQFGINFNQMRILSCILYFRLSEKENQDITMKVLEAQSFKYGAVMDIRPYPINMPYKYIFVQYTNRNDARRAKKGMKRDNYVLQFIRSIKWGKPLTNMKYFDYNRGVGITLKRIKYNDYQAFDIKNCSSAYVCNLDQYGSTMSKITHFNNACISHINGLNDQIEKNYYVGLENIKNNCYINCIIQQLFMIQGFRNEVLINDDNLLHDTFMIMNTTQKKSFYPINIIQKYHTNEQKDCIEMLECILNEKDIMDLSKQYFEGQFRWVIKYGCGCINNNIDEVFKIVQLPVQNAFHLTEALKNEFECETLHNYNCCNCGQITTFGKQCTILKPPNYLFLALKRVKHDYRSKSPKKINTKMEFNEYIDLKNLMFKADAGDIKIDNKENITNNYKFRLKGFIIHRGSALSGHYYSIIQENGEWYCFDDENVSKYEYNIQNMNEYAFGGKLSINDGDGNLVMVDNDCNAYMLLYERQLK